VGSFFENLFVERGLNGQVQTEKLPYFLMAHRSEEAETRFMDYLCKMNSARNSGLQIVLGSGDNSNGREVAGA
jgi:hypothetical protein